MRTTTVSVRGDKAYIRALRLVAEKKGVNIGDIVREALDDKFSDEISLASEQLSFIFPEVSHVSDIKHMQETEEAVQ